MSKPKIKQKVAPKSPMIEAVKRIESKAHVFWWALIGSFLVGIMGGYALALVSISYKGIQ